MPQEQNNASTVPMVPLAVDVIAFGVRPDGTATVASFERRDDLGRTVRALPGALVVQGETIAATARRALGKLGVPISMMAVMEQCIGVVDTQGRDYRLPSLSLPLIAFIAVKEHDDHIFVPLHDINAFDHPAIIEKARQVFFDKVNSTAQDSWAELAAGFLLPDEFRTAQFNQMVRAIAPDGSKISSSNLNRVLTTAMGTRVSDSNLWQANASNVLFDMLSESHKKGPQSILVSLDVE